MNYKFKNYWDHSTLKACIINIKLIYYNNLIVIIILYIFFNE